MTNATSNYELAAILTLASGLALRQEITQEHIQAAEKILNEPQENYWSPKDAVEFLKLHDIHINHLNFLTLEKSMKSLTLRLDPANPKPLVWKELMTKKMYFPFLVEGTRQVTCDGNTDGLLLPAYAALLEEVNELRKAAGLSKIGW